MQRAAFWAKASPWALAALLGPAMAFAQGATSLFGSSFETGEPFAVPAVATDIEAARFLDQATFGGRLQDIARLRQLGYQGWLDEQFAAQVSLEKPYLDWVRTLPAGQNGVYQSQRLEAWFIHTAQLRNPSNPALTHDDQLRQRVGARVVSEILVVVRQERRAAVRTVGAGGLPRPARAHWVRKLTVTLLEHVTLNPVMGRYPRMMATARTTERTSARTKTMRAKSCSCSRSDWCNLTPTARRCRRRQSRPHLQPEHHPRIRARVHRLDLNGGRTAQTDDGCAPGNPYDPEWVTPMVATKLSTTPPQQAVAGVSGPVAC